MAKTPEAQSEGQQATTALMLAQAAQTLGQTRNLLGGPKEGPDIRPEIVEAIQAILKRIKKLAE